jgi:two-component system cell cycle sensor histidine kinase/response regulator CckA
MVDTRKTILLVEDDTLTRDQLGMLLQDGYDVLAARDGIEAAEVYEREKGRIDVVVTDYMMPRLDGARLAKLLACHDAGLPIIMVSGSVGCKEIERLFKLPKFVLLWKPFDVKVLLELVERFTGGP